MAQSCAAATGPTGRSAWTIIPPPLTASGKPGAIHVVDRAEIENLTLNDPPAADPDVGNASVSLSADNLPA